jgi:replication factor A1
LPSFIQRGLNQYDSFLTRWKIKARVSQKSEVKRWSNARGEGKLFSVTFLDESGQIKATGFNDAVDNLYDSLQEGKVYSVSRGKINIAKKQYNTTGHDYEIVFENSTEVEEVMSKFPFFAFYQRKANKSFFL